MRDDAQTKDHGKTFLLTCAACHAKARMHLIEKSSSFFWVCSICNDETALSKKQFEDIKRTAQVFRGIEKELS